MRNSIEETIKTIEKMIKSYKEADKCGLSNNDFKNETKALELILSNYKRVLKENEEYSKQLDLDYVDKNYIPIQKVKDKIRKNEEIIDISNDGDLIHELYQKNKVYEELLDKEN